MPARILALLLLLAVPAIAEEPPPEATPDLPMPPDEPPTAPVLPTPATPAAILTLDDSRATRSLDCAGRTVVVRGTGDRLVLTGGCRSVVVDGAGNLIQAELRPGARITIGGDAVQLTYRLIRPGPPPSIGISGTGSTATPLP